ncbi:MAG: hypothetical protein RH859_00945 [Longimicrobiales bacterium]
MERPEIDQRFRVIQMVWAALAGGVAVYSIVVWFVVSGRLGTSPMGGSAALDATPAIVLMAAAVSMVVAGVVLRRARSLPQGREAAETVAAYQSHVIVSSAVQEGGGLLGLSVAFLAGQATWALGIGAVTVFALFLTRPDRVELDRLLR